MSPAAAAELSGLDKPACPQPCSWSHGCSRTQKRERSQRFRSHRGRNSSTNKEQRCWLLLGAAGGSEEEQRWAWPKPCPCCSCRAKLSGDSPEGSREGPVEAEGAAVLEVLLFPPSLSRFPGAAERAQALLCPPPPAPKDSVHLLWISAGSSSRLPALMKPALESLSLGKGGVIQHKQLSGTAPALAVLP